MGEKAEGSRERAPLSNWSSQSGSMGGGQGGEREGGILFKRRGECKGVGGRAAVSTGLGLRTDGVEGLATRMGKPGSGGKNQQDRRGVQKPRLR